MRACAELPKLCEFFHIPFQSGDNDILREMRWPPCPSVTEILNQDSLIAVVLQGMPTWRPVLVHGWGHWSPLRQQTLASWTSGRQGCDLQCVARLETRPQAAR